MTDKNYIFPYINWKGDFSLRECVPCKINFEVNNKYHGNAWIMTAYDLDKQDVRSFNMDDILKGTIQHTLREMKITVTQERVDGIFRRLDKGYTCF